jgi:hypothetical protein
MVMGLIREANHEVNGSLATYQIDDHSGGLLEVKWWHDVSTSSKDYLQNEDFYFRIPVNHYNH